MKSPTLHKQNLEKARGIQESVTSTYFARWMTLLVLPVLLFGRMMVASTPDILPGTAALAKGHGGVGNWDAIINSEIDRSTATRSRFWQRDFSSPEIVPR